MRLRVLGGQPALNGQSADMIRAALLEWRSQDAVPRAPVLLADFYGTDIGDFVFTLRKSSVAG